MRNLNSIIPGAENFRYKEFTKSAVAIRKGINNIPNDENIWQNIEKLARTILQPIRNEFGGVRITSGYRSPELNTAIGGSNRSFHCVGMAADIEPLAPGVTLMDVMEFVVGGLDFTEAIAEYWPGGWNHLAIANERENERVLKLKDERHNYKVVGWDYIKNIYG